MFCVLLCVWTLLLFYVRRDLVGFAFVVCCCWELLDCRLCVMLRMCCCCDRCVFVQGVLYYYWWCLCWLDVSWLFVLRMCDFIVYVYVLLLVSA